MRTHPEPVRRLLAVRNRIMPHVRGAFLAAVHGLRAFDERRVEDALAAGHPDLAFHLLPWDRWRHALDSHLYPSILFGMAAGGRHGERHLAVLTKAATPPPEFAVRFDLANPEAVRAAASEVGWLIQRVDVQTRAAVAEIIRRGALGQLDTRAMAREIQQLVGLDVRQTNALLNYEWGLRREGRAEADIVRLVQRQYDHRLRYRATMIARTESARAAILGQNAAWRQAADAGLLDRRATLRTWVASAGACPICADLSGQRVALDEPFGPDLQGATPDGPPAHPNCRCALTLDLGYGTARRAAARAA